MWRASTVLTYNIISVLLFNCVAFHLLKFKNFTVPYLYKKYAEQLTWGLPGQCCSLRLDKGHMNLFNKPHWTRKGWRSTLPYLCDRRTHSQRSSNKKIGTSWRRKQNKSEWRYQRLWHVRACFDGTSYNFLSNLKFFEGSFAYELLI